MPEPTYSCRGPHVRIFLETGQEDPDGIAFLVKSMELADRSPASLRRLREEIEYHRVHGCKFMRSGCGQDLTDLVRDVPRDGFPHDITCPTCGESHEIRKS